MLKLQQKKRGEKNRGLVERYKLAGQVTAGLALGLVSAARTRSRRTCRRRRRRCRSSSTTSSRRWRASRGLYVIVHDVHPHRHEQRREHHRRSRRTGGRAVGDRVRHVRDLRVHHRPRRLQPLPGHVLSPGLRRADGVLLWRWSARSSDSSGTTRTRRRSSWATRASLALGGGLGAVAILLKSEFVLAFVGAVFVAEMMSVILQRYVFKYRKRRHGLEYARDAPRLSPSAAAPSLRGAGLEGDAGRRPVLDHRDPVRVLRPEHAQAAVTHGARSRTRRCRLEWLRGEIAVVGLARSGRRAAQLLARAGARRLRVGRSATSPSSTRPPRALRDEGVDVERRRPRPRAHRARVARRRESRRAAGRAAVRRGARARASTS